MSEVRVIIRDELGGEEQLTKNTSSQVTTAKASKMPVANNKESKMAISKSQNIAIAAMLAKQTISYATSNVGKWTGNKHNQVMVDNATDIASLGILALVNPYVAIATTAFKIGTTAIDSAYEQHFDRLASNRALARAGFTSTGEAIGYRRNK